MTTNLKPVNNIESKMSLMSRAIDVSRARPSILIHVNTDGSTEIAFCFLKLYKEQNFTNS